MQPVRHHLLARKIGYWMMPGRFPRTLSWPCLLAGSRAQLNDDDAAFASPLTLCFRTRRGKGPARRPTHSLRAREIGSLLMRRTLCGTLRTLHSKAVSTRGGSGGSHGCILCVAMFDACLLKEMKKSRNLLYLPLKILHLGAVRTKTYFWNSDGSENIAEKNVWEKSV